jgi:hypothetical protein
MSRLNVLTVVYGGVERYTSVMKKNLSHVWVGYPAQYVVRMLLSTTGTLATT